MKLKGKVSSTTVDSIAVEFINAYSTVGLFLIGWMIFFLLYMIKLYISTHTEASCSLEALLKWYLVIVPPGISWHLDIHNLGTSLHDLSI